MIYLICQDWANTSNNHAGIKYLCNQLQKQYPQDYSSIVIPAFFNDFQLKKNPIVAKIQFLVARHRHKIYVRKLFKQLSPKINKQDKIILMEYLEKFLPMVCFAERFKEIHPTVPLFAMVHLVPSRLDKSFSTFEELDKWLKPIDKVITLGHSLTDYLTGRGISRNKIYTTFHYVDEFYYNPNYLRANETKRIIAMGNQMRNVKLLKEIVKVNPNIEFIICQGVSDMSLDFKDFDNVTLIPFVSETELREYMRTADISLNVMEDTVGSNVIVTSLAMGLAMVCSDVGSIRDYCDESNTYFCNNTVKSFSEAIAKLTMDSITSLQESAYNRGQELSIEKFSSFLKNM